MNIKNQMLYQQVERNSIFAIIPLLIIYKKIENTGIIIEFRIIFAAENYSNYRFCNNSSHEFKEN